MRMPSLFTPRIMLLPGKKSRWWLIHKKYALRSTSTVFFFLFPLCVCLKRLASWVMDRLEIRIWQIKCQATLLICLEPAQLYSTECELLGGPETTNNAWNGSRKVACKLARLIKTTKVSGGEETTHGQCVCAGRHLDTCLSSPVDKWCAHFIVTTELFSLIANAWNIALDAFWEREKKKYYLANAFWRKNRDFNLNDLLLDTIVKPLRKSHKRRSERRGGQGGAQQVFIASICRFFFRFKEEA